MSGSGTASGLDGEARPSSLESGSPESCSFKPPGMANDESEEGLALRVRFRTSLYLFALRRGGV